VVWLTARRSHIDEGIGVRIAEGYEWIFWGAIGLQVMTGVGNLGAFGDALPGPGSAWATKLTIKLLAVLAFAVLSVPRTFVVATMAAEGRAKPRLLPALYGATTAYVVVILGLAEWLAHG
jgi:hypothetical protein